MQGKLMQKHYVNIKPLFKSHKIAFILKILSLISFFTVHSQATIFDNYYLHLAYKSYEARDFNKTQKYLKQIKQRSLQSQIILANTYYKQHSFKKAIKTYTSIHSTSSHIKQQLYYNIANTYAKLGKYNKAKTYYAKTLQLNDDKDAKHNLKLIALMKDKLSANLGISHPKSQSSSSSKSDSQESNKEETKNEDQPSSGSGSGGENKAKEEEKHKLMSDESQEPHPLSSKVYELINKGYIHEKQPW